MERPCFNCRRYVSFVWVILIAGKHGLHRILACNECLQEHGRDSLIRKQETINRINNERVRAQRLNALRRMCDDRLRSFLSLSDEAWRKLEPVLNLADPTLVILINARRGMVT